MQVQHESIVDFSDAFKALQSSIACVNYNVDFFARAFTFDGESKSFDLNCFRKIYYNEVKQECSDTCREQHTSKDSRYLCISGEIEKHDSKSSTAEINAALAFDRDLCGTHLIGSTDVIDKAIQDRQEFFWRIIEKHFNDVASAEVFIHKPDFMSFFDLGGVMWEFCFIFVNKKTQQGLVLAGNAYD